jgi:hypothetical protein
VGRTSHIVPGEAQVKQVRKHVVPNRLNILSGSLLDDSGLGFLSGSCWSQRETGQCAWVLGALAVDGCQGAVVEG